MPDDRMTAATIVGALKARHHPSDGWVALDEVTCPATHRRIDLLAISIYEMTRRVVAYEVKVSRADFMRELADPSKRSVAEGLAGECLFATPKGLIAPDETPDGWGLVELCGSQLRQKVAPRQRELTVVDWYDVAMILRRLHSPGTRLEKAVWRLAGKELNEEQIAEVVQSAYERELESARRDGHSAAGDEYRQRLQEHPDHEIAGLVRDWFGRMHGWQSPTPEQIRQGLALLAVPPAKLLDLRDEVRGLLSEMDGLLGVEPAEAGGED